ncbi:hypothetical protein KBA73_03000 [Patescibacteria group bacterium]|nr:hypothetical protein [Patescibacteria group bacterium]
MTRPLSKTSTANLLTMTGLTEREGLIWETLATGVPLHVSQLAQATELHRPAVYLALKALLKKELITFVTQRKRVLYTTTGVDQLKQYAATREKALKGFLKTVPALPGASSIASKELRIFHGKELVEVWKIIRDETPKRTTFFRYDAYSPKMSASLYMPAGYYADMEKKKLERFVITNQGLRSAKYVKKMECASQVLPASFDRFEQGVTQFIVGDLLALVDFTTETAFVIRNKALAEYHKQLFLFVYSRLKEDALR